MVGFRLSRYAELGYDIRMTKEEQSAAFRAMWKQVITPAFEFVNRLIDAEEPPEHLIHFTERRRLPGHHQEQEAMAE